MELKRIFAQIHEAEDKGMKVNENKTLADIHEEAQNFLIGYAQAQKRKEEQGESGPVYRVIETFRSYPLHSKIYSVISIKGAFHYMSEWYNDKDDAQKECDYLNEKARQRKEATQ